MIPAFVAGIKFELNIRRKSLSTYVYFLLFLSLAYLMGTAAGGAYGGVTISFGFSNKIFLNSAVSLTGLLALLSAFSLFISAPAFGQALVKDYANQFDQIIYSSPVNRRVFVLSRFIAALVFMILVLSSMGLGLFLATLDPRVLKTSLTANHLINYLWPYVLIVIPNLFTFGSIFFLIAAQTKRMAPVYIVTILIFMGWLMSGQVLSEVENKMLGSLLDPFGINAAMESTKYWSADQQNTQRLGFESYLLYNRLLWAGLGLLCFLVSLTSFKFKEFKAKVREPELPLKLGPMPDLSAPVYSAWAMFRRQLRFEFTQVFKSIYFQTLVLAGICYMFVAGQTVGRMMGTNTFPVTYMILDFVGGSFDLFLMIIVTFFAGEVIWRDRDQKTQQIIDASPVPNGVLLSAKYLTLIGVVAALFLTVIVCGMLIQIFNGYTNFELGLYLRQLYGLRLFYYVNLVSLVFFLHVLTGDKYLSHGLAVVYYIAYLWGPELGFEHMLYNFNSAPSARYSDMNGFGPFAAQQLTVRFYWLLLAVAMMTVAYLAWQRGNLTGFKDRKLEFLRRAGPRAKIVLGLSLASFAAMGGFLFYNSNVLNSYVTNAESEKLDVEYERKYASHRYTPTPNIVGVVAKVDLFPETQSASFDMDYRLKNRSNAPLDTVFVNLPGRHRKDMAFDLTFDHPFTVELDDSELGVRIYRLKPPLAPGEEIKARYTAQTRPRGIPNSGAGRRQILNNGTFFNQSTFAPMFGYNVDREIAQNKTRSKYKMPDRRRIAEISDEREQNFNGLTREGAWIDFEATVSTSPDQIAIAPGYLQETWEEGGRKFFKYAMNRPILNFYSFLSGRYRVKTDRWNDVNVEIYYHPGHEYNVDKMLEASKDSLEYFANNFGPYQFTQYRVIEFPRYASFAQSFPNTVPFSEAIGVIANVNPDNPKDVDYPYFITAHEFAHQYWGHQVVPASVQGAYFITESFAEYTALLVMQKKYGRTKMKRFLRDELERYLSGRQQEDEYESSLALSEGQSYIHYQKGSLALFALQEYLGEDLLNGVIRDYLKKVKFQSGPYTVSYDFISLLKSRVNPAQIPLVEDLLEKIVLFENRPVEAQYKKLADGKFEVRLKVSATKYRADKDGKENAVPFQQRFDVGVTDAKGEYLYLAKHEFKEGDNEIVVRVDREPKQAGIDPLNYIIDKSPDDNMMDVRDSGTDKKIL